jgi:hypothetical protein
VMVTMLNMRCLLSQVDRVGKSRRYITDNRQLDRVNGEKRRQLD